MCGIAGFLNLNHQPADKALLQPMVARLVHRGPDGDGHIVDGELALGHRRLAIIDVTPAAAQPMHSEDGRWVISYNGELYNFKKLRTELRALGHSFRTASDTEVVLAALAQWGVEALKRFNGMFAFALWDRRERTLMLARDRYGIKPMYWGVFGNTLLFASEIKAFTMHPEFVPAMDVEALAEYLTFQNFFSERLLFKGVMSLPAGSFISVSAGNPSPKLVMYWDFKFQEPIAPRTESEYLAEFDHLFCQAVDRSLVSDVPVGAYLSGGMDTGSITAVAAKSNPGMFSFTVGFDMRSASGIELNYDERANAEYMSHLFKTEHYEMVLKAGDMERTMSDLVWHMEEPRVGQSYPNFYAAKLASKFNKVVLSGTGGDELFGGYPWRYYRGMQSTGFEDYVDKYFDFWQRLVPGELISELMAPSSQGITASVMREKFRSAFRHHDKSLTRPEDYVNHSLYFEAKTFLQGLLHVEDKLAMAHGLEVRPPFLDNDLADFAQKLPVHMKLRHLTESSRINENEAGNKPERYFQRTQDGKYLLRKAMRKYVPESVAWGPKQGFSGPDGSWFKGESMDFVRETLYRSDAMIYNYIDRSVACALIDEHLDGKKNRRLLIWSLLNLEFWCRIFLADSRSEMGSRGPVRCGVT